MIRHIVIAALRNMMANKLLSAIAILGLAVGITTLLTAVSLVRGISRWDHFIPGHEQTVMVTMPSTRAGAAYSFNSDPRIAGLLKIGLPDVENAARLVSEGAVLRHGNVVARETFYWADPAISEVLPLPVYRGDFRAALAVPDGAAMTRSTARKYFGREDVVGEAISLSGRSRTIRAVMQDLPTQTELHGNAVFISALSPDADPRLTVGGAGTDAGDGGILTYLRLRPGVDPDAIQKRAHDAIMPVLAARPFKGGGPDADAPLLLRLDRGIWSEKINPGFRTAVALGFAICGLLLFVASVNFVNIMTARAARRAAEVSVRKVCGASRGDLILQFLGESILTVFLSTCVALAINEWMLGKINGLGQAAPLDFWRDPLLLAALLLGIVLLGSAAGAWPAFVLSSFRPVRVLKGLSGNVGRAGLIRTGLVTLQFAALIGFTIAAIIIYQQHVFAVSRPLSVQIERMLMLEADCRPAFIAELRKLPGVVGASCTGEEFFTNNSTVAFSRNGATITLDMVRSDRDALALYGIRPIAGSLPAGPSADPGAAQGLVLNQSAVHKLGFVSPQAAIGQVLTHSKELAERPVIAVVPDFALYSIERPMEPTVFLPVAFISCCERVSLKLRQGRLPETLAAIDRIWVATGGDGPLHRSFLDERLREQYVGLLQSANMFAICALVAVFLACLGLTGLAISNAERRTKEIGIRKAMGAASGTIVVLLLTQFSRPVLWANLIAWPVAWYGMHGWLSGFAYHVPLQVWVFVVASLLALLIALITVAGHAIWASRQKPVLALRYE